jgi:IS30 family transposase
MIYRQVYQETAKIPSLKVRFRQNHSKLRQRSGIKNRRSRILDRISIDQRPKVVEGKSHAGDWEGGTVESAGKNACIANPLCV